MKKPTPEEIAFSAKLLSEQLQVDEATCRAWLESGNPFEGFDSMLLAQQQSRYPKTASVSEIERGDYCHA